MRKIFTLFALLVLYVLRVHAIVFVDPSSGTVPSKFRITLGADGSTSYTIQIFDNPDFLNTPVFESVGSRTAWVTSLVAGNTYYARGFGDLTPLSSFAKKTIFVSSAITSVTPTIANGTILNGNPFFNTTANSSATAYDWQFDTDPNFTSSDLLNFSSTSTSIQIPRYTLKSGTLYYIRTRGKNSGETGPWTLTSNIKSFTAELHVTSIVSPSNGVVLNNNGIKIQFNRILNATSYQLQVSTNSDFSSILYSLNVTDATPSDQYFTFDYLGKKDVSPLSFGIGYNIRIVAKNTNQQSAFSSYFRFSTGYPAISFENIVSGNTYSPNFQLKLKSPVSYGITSYTLQLSKSPNFTNLVYNVTQKGRIFDITKVIPRGVTLYARARANNYTYSGPIENFIISSTPVVTITTPIDNSLIQKGVWIYSKADFAMADLTYEFEADTVNTFDSNRLIQKSVVSQGSFSSSDFLYDRTYYVRVRGIVNSTSAVGNWSPYVTYTTKPKALKVSKDMIFEDVVNEDALAFPNPFNEIIYLNKNNEVNSIQMQDVFGKQYSVFYDSYKNSINTSNLDKGVYLLRVNFVGKEEQIIRLIKE